jgi:hypothetical protein
MSNERSAGCKYREWGWHDGGPDYKCTALGENYCCKNSWDDAYNDINCEYKGDKWQKNNTALKLN